MPLRWFICPDGKKVEVKQCLKFRGCRMRQRCATLPYLRLVGYDRKWKGVTPSAAGNGARYLFLKATTDYAIDPQDRAWAAIGVGTHSKLSIHAYTFDVLSEEKLSGHKIEGIADVLEESEYKEGYYDLYDYKTYGSFKTLKALGADYVDLFDEEGNPILYKSGKKKGKQKKGYVLGLKKPSLRNEELQLNMYRILFESNGFPIHRMMLQIMPRDGGTHIAFSRNITRNIYLVRVKRLDDDEVLSYYRNLAMQVKKAMMDGWAPKCDKWESWQGRKCDGYCEVTEACKLLDKEEQNGKRKSVS